MKVLILSRRPDLYSVRRLDEEFKAAGHSSVVLDPETPDVRKQEPDLVVPRFGSFKFEESLELIEYYERRKIPSLNRANSLRDARQKWIASLILREEGLPIPTTSLSSKSNLPSQYPYVVKVPDLLKGEGIMLVRGPADRMALPALSEWVVQEFVADANGEDNRVLVNKKGFIASMKRKAPEGDFRSNIAIGGKAEIYDATKMEIDLAMRALHALNLEIAAVDFLPSKHGPLICEVNGCPGLEGIEKVSGANVAAAYVQTAEAILARG